MKTVAMKTVGWGVTAILLVAPGALLAKIPALSRDAALSEKVRHELVMLPWYGVFDNLAYEVHNGQVTLTGQVTRPTLKSDAEKAVKAVPGVTAVENQIEVLPLSPYDDHIRLAVARSIYGFSSLYRYAVGSQPSIRIIVKNGAVTLEGVVSTDMDRRLAEIRANSVPGVFSVTNHLVVAGKHA